MIIKLIHGDIDLYTEINEEVRIAALKQISKIKSNLKEYKSTIIKEEISLIKQIHSSAQKTLELLKFQTKKINEIILKVQNLKIIDNSKEATFIESMLKLSPNDLWKIQSIQSPDLLVRHIGSGHIQKLFELGELSEQNLLIDMNYKNESHIIKFIQTTNNTLQTFDAETWNFKYIKPTNRIDFNQYGATCLLSDGSLFYSNLGLSLIIDSEGSIKHLPQYNKKDLNAGAIYKDGDIYLFGGSYNTSAKFNLAKNIWTPLAKLPISLGDHTSSSIFKNYILLGSTKTSKILYYDIIIDSFNEILFSNLVSWMPKIFFVVNETLYFPDFSSNHYEITDNLVTWNQVDDHSFSSYNNSLVICSPIIYNQKYYYANHRSILTFDLKKKKIEEVAKIP